MNHNRALPLRTAGAFSSQQHRLPKTNQTVNWLAQELLATPHR